MAFWVGKLLPIYLYSLKIKYMIYVGIDYSLTSPSVCVYNSDRGDFVFDNCTFSVISDVKIPPNLPKNIFISPHKPWTNQDERYHNIADYLIKTNCLESADVILIEDYAFAAKGRVFGIAENTEVLQYNLWLKKKQYTKISPKSIKKWATGSGNAAKEQMVEAFHKNPKNPDMFSIFASPRKKTGKVDSPLSDIVDSYFICGWAVTNL